MSSRDLILSRLRSQTHAAPPPALPYRPTMLDSLAQHFTARATAALATVAHLDFLEDLPREVAHYLDGHDIAGSIAIADSLAGLTWEMARLPRADAPGRESMRISVAPVAAAIAETGSIILTSQDPHGPWPNLLADTHIAVVPKDVIVPSLEEAVAKLAGNHRPRSMHVATGPSRTGDIEQTLELGAHGAVRLHIVIIG